MGSVRARPAEDSGYNSIMQTYLVGGAVRDQLLGLPVRERDWVVVGATPGELEKLGYRRVGRDFPVYLHPESSEEHALARTERKTSPGYRGFEVQADPSVTLEEDLQRRDLTINAMAQTADGRIIDPAGGRAHLEARLLHHVSDAFREDPVRILRVARFAARLHDLGFDLIVAPPGGLYAAVEALRGAYATLAEKGTLRDDLDQVMSFDEFNALVDLDAHYETEERFR